MLVFIYFVFAILCSRTKYYVKQANTCTNSLLIQRLTWCQYVRLLRAF